jgi:hypothetical protein
VRAANASDAGKLVSPVCVHRRRCPFRSRVDDGHAPAGVITAEAMTTVNAGRRSSVSDSSCAPFQKMSRPSSVRRSWGPADPCRPLIERSIYDCEAPPDIRERNDDSWGTVVATRTPRRMTMRTIEGPPKRSTGRRVRPFVRAPDRPGSSAPPRPQCLRVRRVWHRGTHAAALQLGGVESLGVAAVERREDRDAARWCAAPGRGRRVAASFDR